MVEPRAWVRVPIVTLITSITVFLSVGNVGAEDTGGVLERTRGFYAGTEAFHETLELELVMPDGSRSRRRQDYGVDGHGGAFFRLAAEGRDGMRIVARDGRIVAIWAHIPNRYAEASYTGDFAAALTLLKAPQVQLWAPPAIVAAQGGDMAAFGEALRFGILAPVEPVAIIEAGDPSIVEVEMRAENGVVFLGVDRVAGRFRSARFRLGEGDSQIEATGTFSFSAGEPVGELEWPELGGRATVATLTALEASTYPIGEAAPRIKIASLDGEDIDLGSLVGRVVVLDFWATWCVPCWTALEHTEALTDWAKSSGLPVAVYAVDSLERVDGLEDQRKQARRFLQSKGLDLEVLIDHDNSAFAAFHNPGLPSLVIIDPRGRLAEYHSGVLEDMAEAIKAKVEDLLDSSG